MLGRPGPVSVADSTAGFVAAHARSDRTPPSPQCLAEVFSRLRLSFYAVDVAKGFVDALGLEAVVPRWRDVLLRVDAVVAVVDACQPMVRGDVLRVLLPALDSDESRRFALSRVALPPSEASSLMLQSPRVFSEGALR